MSRIDFHGRLLIVAGVGFRDERSVHDQGNIFLTSGIKPNIGAVVALEAARAGYSVALLARTSSKLEHVRTSIVELAPSADVVVHAVDLLDSAAVQRLTENLGSSQEIDFVHSAGLGAGSYRLPNDNPYLAVEETPADLPSLEFESVVKSLLIAVQAFLPKWRTQHQCRIVVVSSMSGVRAVPLGFSHASAKAALHQAVRSLTLELNPSGIRICEVLPGIVNTGLYDPEPVDRAARRIGEAFGYHYEPSQLPQMDAEAVADAVMLCLRSNAHVLSVAMVASGQFPHLGS